MTLPAPLGPAQFQQKWVPVLSLELRQNKLFELIK